MIISVVSVCTNGFGATCIQCRVTDDEWRLRVGKTRPLTKVYSSALT